MSAALTLAPSPIMWPGDGPRLTAERLDGLLAWASNLGASDIRLETGKRIILQVHGRVLKVSTRRLTEYEAEMAVNRLTNQDDGVAWLRTARPLDVAYEPGLLEGYGRLRYRINAKGTLFKGQGGVAVIARTLPTTPRPLATQNVEYGILRAFKPKTGLVLIAGGTGEGKSTLAAGMVLDILLDPSSNRIIVEYSAPVEYVFDGIDGPSSEITQIQIGLNIETFAMAIRDAMRSNADTIVIGECRDGETMEAALDAALANHAVYTSIHAGTAYETIQRAVRLCPVAQRDALTTSMAQALRLIVNQRLLWSADGTRTPVREYLICDKGVRRQLALTNPEKWPQLVEALVEERGTSFAHSIRRALAEGRISEEVANDNLLGEAAHVA
ncbi:type IV pilus twitching motility protein PilT [Paeniroseomonas aquatica]|uniref:ATPase, T2SS/T4P/T4SS family n=1 Tax=Paeniroseomonas aquatica TaxID=373043 RepID=A0ABT8A075_9PROT|nr:ATPase, T2SS/T4P/T4SS family [Paeniroseomonas aquatica]MDN3563104.1 ATPase, T2SS/T4P/T4SS family [Paeniroseomonas aquatica]